MKFLRYGLVCACTFLLLQGCATTPKANSSPEELYAHGEAAFTKSRYTQAITHWKLVKEAFPAPELAAKAEIGIANAYFLNKDFIEAGAAYEDFRKLHPTNDLAQFALYRQALSSYNLITGIDTDQTPTHNALTLFERFVQLYPKSQYVAKAQEKIAECRSKLSQYQIYVGRYYYRTGHYASAIGRLEGALTKYPDYTGHDETLFFLGKAYLVSKQNEKMRSTFSRLVREYPSSSYLADARKLLAEKP